MDRFLLKPQDQESCRGLGPTGSLQARAVLWKAKPRPGEWKLISCPLFLQDLVRWFFWKK